jgi:DNA-binding PadR family transcriptional regulator
VDPTLFLPLPSAQYHVLVALSSGELHGYAIMQAVEASSAGVVKMGPASLYGTLNRLVDAGLVVETAQRPSIGDDQRRRYYQLTALGGDVCLAESDRLAALARRARGNLRPRTA